MTYIWPTLAYMLKLFNERHVQSQTYMINSEMVVSCHFTIVLSHIIETVLKKTQKNDKISVADHSIHTVVFNFLATLLRR